MKINKSKHIWEGWTIGDFIKELEPQFNFINSNDSLRYNRNLKTKDDIKKWCIDNQPYYKKPIPEVVEYFFDKLQK